MSDHQGVLQDGIILTMATGLGLRLLHPGTGENRSAKPNSTCQLIELYVNRTPNVLI